MLKKLNTCALLGLSGQLVEVEVFVTRGKPVFDIIGLPDAAINEAKIRVRSAINNSKLEYPYTRRIIANLAPADLRKEGPGYDLAFAVGILMNDESIKFDLSDSLLVGELSLEGQLRHVNGILSIVDFAKKSGFKKVFLPAIDAAEGCLIGSIDVYPVNSLAEMARHLRGELIQPVHRTSSIVVGENPAYEFDMSYVKGQFQAKRALEIAAAGQHNIIMSGPPGSGKSLLAKCLPSILPSLSEEEVLEVTKIYSVCGLTSARAPLITRRPFRTPHHTSSTISLIGGGRVPRPGEISLANRGVLFLDEFPEFSRHTLETLRQPLEDGKVTISRAQASLTYPARFMLVASQNPCPCGFLSDPGRKCVCAPSVVLRYQQKISGPILDRIDLHVSVPRLPFDDLKNQTLSESSSDIRKRVESARDIQRERFSGLNIDFNSEMQAREIRKHCDLDEPSQELIKQAVEKLNLSARGYHRIIKLSRTIADLEASANITANHVAEALQYRMK